MKNTLLLLISTFALISFGAEIEVDISQACLSPVNLVIHSGTMVSWVRRVNGEAQLVESYIGEFKSDQLVAADAKFSYVFTILGGSPIPCNSTSFSTKRPRMSRFDNGFGFDQSSATGLHQQPC